MGFTHYWQRPVELPRYGFAAASAATMRYAHSARAELAGFDGKGSPLFTPERVVFNGPGAQGCEAFEIAQVEFDTRGQPQFWRSCKTERLPYDGLVMAALVIFKAHLGDLIVVESDAAQAEWQNVARRVETLLGIGCDFRLGPSQG